MADDGRVHPARRGRPVPGHVSRFAIDFIGCLSGLKEPFRRLLKHRFAGNAR